MQNSTINTILAEPLNALGLSQLPREVIDRDGRIMDVSGDVWKFNIAHEVGSHNWSTMGLVNPIIAYAMKRYVIHVAQINSPIEVFGTVKDLRELLTGRTFEPEKGNQVESCQNDVRDQWVALQDIQGIDVLSEQIFILLGRVVTALRRKKMMYRFRRIRAWFIWATDIIPELGFSEEYALELNQIYVPGSVKGRAVETDDEDGGPLWDSEVRAVRLALSQDKSTWRPHVMERAAVALGLIFGRNSANYVLLREEDFWNEMVGLAADDGNQDVEPEYRLNIPRIKKRGVCARGQMRTEYIYGNVAPFILDLIEANREIDTGKRPRPLFMRKEVDERRVGTGVDEYAYHLTSTDFGSLVRMFTKRMNIISPRTKGKLKLSPRRLRYTFATSMVELGVSPKVLARMLDHSDTQCVMIYFALKGKRLTKQLDKAAAFKLASFFQLFKGRIVDSDSDAINGDDQTKKMFFTGANSPDKVVSIGVCGNKPLCSLDPPFSCYLCGLFQPYREANHEAVLEALLSERDQRKDKYGTRIGVQIDDVILAVANVITKIAGVTRGFNNVY